MTYRSFAFAAMVLVTACSGGGSTTSPSSGSSPPPPPPPTSNAAVPTSFTEQAVLRGIVHDFGYSNDMNAMVRLFAGGAASGDIDGDGDIDLFILRGNLGPNLLYLNQGGSAFSESAAAANLAYTKDAITNYRQSGPVFGDIDGDGDLDLFLGGLGNDPSQIHLNNGTGVFTNATSGSGLDLMTSAYTVSAAMGDYDLDGDVDVLLLTVDDQQAALLWTNNLQGANAITIQLQGLTPNTMAIGARISVRTGTLTQTRLVSINSNFTSHNSTEQIIGLGDSQIIDAIDVIWPDGKTSSMTNVTANQRLIMQQPT